MKNIRKMLITVGSLIVLSSLISACNTVEGAGQDMQAGGQAISKAANDAK